MPYIKRATTIVGTFILILIVYLQYFNHPPASATLDKNVKISLDGGGFHQPPHFHRLLLGGSRDDDSRQDASDGVGRALRSSNTSAVGSSSSDIKNSREDRGGNANADLSNRDVGSEGGNDNSVTDDDVAGTGEDVVDEVPVPPAPDGEMEEVDWDEWVKVHNYVEIGTIWTDCGKYGGPIASISNGLKLVDF